MNTPPTLESPVKSISVREDQFGARALHYKAGKRRYRCIANFYFIIDSFVQFETCKKYNGYILNVHRTDGVAM
jgi:hypothetical protein